MPAPSPFAAFLSATALFAAPLAPIGAGVASAPIAAAESGGTFLPFSSTLRRCDYSVRQYYDSAGMARATATVGSGSGQVTADVQMALAKPNTFYEVRLIQAPRESAAGCGPGAPGTAAGTLHTDGVGAGAITLSSPLMAGATGAWVSIERPQPNSQLPAEFYTTDFIVKT
ncbi:hypothetical protein [Mycolicibacterium litorale]|uniref:Secreted protein n=1 Tax=Mycolicibacterium litorale TaxID=758802 RepID=A0AAD1IIT3_9MYCO|nr:hypothetical protein [Mycolicibacterium litorale]MCV7414871.1 hypothetical protein [Mycolicibacterium litorale]TDY08118.1 hypothetical protein BCL50_0180 [Mycolicibacterium litorale]BBY16039.1 hypothetical protein MLIT_16310 [Mycolicibacterium litorale]